MADEKKKAVAKAETSKAAKSDKKEKKDKKPSKFSPKNIGKSVVRFFKDLRGETKKIVWPSRQMVLKSTGIVLAAILVIGAGIWIIDFALSAGIEAVDKAANETEATTVESTVAETEEDVNTSTASTTTA